MVILVNIAILGWIGCSNFKFLLQMQVTSSIFKFCPLVKQNMDFVDADTVRSLMVVGELCLSSTQHAARVFQVLEIVRCSVPSADGTSGYAYSRHCLQKQYVPTGCFCEACALASEYENSQSNATGSFAKPSVMSFLLNLVAWRCHSSDGPDGVPWDDRARDGDFIRLFSLIIGLQQLDVVPQDLTVAIELVLSVLHTIAERLYSALSNLQDHAVLWRSLVAIAQAVSIIYWWVSGPVGKSLGKDMQARRLFHPIGKAAIIWGMVFDVSFRAFSELLPRPDIKAQGIRVYPLLARCPIGVVIFILHLSVEISLVHPQSLFQLELRHKRVLSILVSFCEKEYHEVMRRNRYDLGFQPLSLLSIMANHSPGVVGPSLSRLHQVDRALSWFVDLHKDCTVAGELSSSIHKIVVVARTVTNGPSSNRRRLAPTVQSSPLISWQTILSSFGSQSGSQLAMTFLLFFIVFGGATAIMITITMEALAQNDVQFTLVPHSVNMDALR